MSAAAGKLERTGSALRSVWPNVKQQCSGHESGLIRKNSGQKKSRAEAVAGASFSPPARSATAARGLPRRLRLQQDPAVAFSARGGALRQQQRAARAIAPGPRHIASDFLRSQAGFKEGRSFVASTSVVPAQESSFSPVPVASPVEDTSRSGTSIEELIQIASDKYKLNADFWGKYSDIPSMAQASEKEDILQIIENFALIHRKHVYLFQKLKNTVIKNLAPWSAPDLATLCHAWAQLGFLHEDLCVAMAERATATVHACNAQELCWLMDAYATARCSVRSVTEEITTRTLVTLDEFNLQQMCLHASSFARLNIHHEALFKAMASHLASPGSAQIEPVFSARDLTLAAYSFAKLGYFFPEVFRIIALNAQKVIRDFTARDLQMLIVAFARAEYHDADLLSAVSLQAQRRIAQFSAESLTLMLRSLAFFDFRDSGLFTRALAQLPRMILTFRPADVTTLLSACAAAQVHSEALFDVVTPFILEKAPMFTPADWLSALRSYSALGQRDSMFLHAMTLHLEVSRLNLRQLSVAMVDCCRLSYLGQSGPLAEAATAKLETEGSAPGSADALAQMYASLLLLGHSSHVSPLSASGNAPPDLLRGIAQRLRNQGTCEALSVATRVSLCYAMLLAPPVRGERHPAAAATLLELCAAEAGALTAEERAMLQQAFRAPELLPWNRRAINSEAVDLGPRSEAGNLEPSAPFLLAAVSHLAPLQPALDEPAPRAVGSGELQAGLQGPRWRGIFVAYEIQTGLQELSGALSAIGIESRLVADSETEAHVLLAQRAVRPAAAAEGQIALLWGSSVHYMSGAAGSEGAKPKLTPAAKFQVALLQNTRQVEAVVVPHWWWHDADGAENIGRRLADFLSKGDALPEASSASALAGLARPRQPRSVE